MYSQSAIVFVGLMGSLALQAQGLRAVSAASFQPSVAPDSVASVLGTGLAPRAVSAVRDENGALPFEIDGVQVRVGSLQARLLDLSPRRVNFVVPAELEPGTHDLIVQNGSETLTGLAEVRATAPAIFSRDGTGQGLGSIVDAESLGAGPFLVESGDRSQTDRRTRLRVFATGLRRAGGENSPSDGNVARHVDAQAVFHDGEQITLELEFAGPAPGLEGTDVLDFVLPEQLDGAGTVELQLRVGQAESNPVTFEVGLLPANQLRLRAVDINTAAARGGDSVTGVVRLNGVARGGGLLVRLESSSPIAQVPWFVQVEEGKSTAPFTVNTAPVGSPQRVTISGDLNGACESADLIVKPAGFVGLERLSITPSSLAGGADAAGLVTLNSTEHSGFRVALRSNSPRIRVPAIVDVPAGRSNATFRITTSAVAEFTQVELVAEADDVSRSAKVALLPVVSVTLERQEVVGGAVVRAEVRLNRAPSSSAVVVGLTSNSPEVRVPQSVTIPPGRVSAAFEVRTLQVNAAKEALFSADHLGMKQTVRIKLRPVSSDRVESIVLSPRTVRGGEPVTATVTLEGPATFPAVTLFLGTDSPFVAQVPVVYYVPAGRTTVQFTITTSPVWQPRDVKISASSGGHTATAGLRVN
ncbi:MAG: hypothetical protein K2X03_11090 [Bryobacteraceae bacterium]|nr:hypothetical protein [Bryobacteraceae bacterium]